MKRPTNRSGILFAKYTHKIPQKKMQFPVINDFFLPIYSACIPPINEPTNAPNTEILAKNKSYNNSKGKEDIANMIKVASLTRKGSVSYTHLTLPTNREV